MVEWNDKSLVIKIMSNNDYRDQIKHQRGIERERASEDVDLKKDSSR